MEDGVHRRGDIEVASTIYRIVQEALTNVAKHADASQVSVVLEIGDEGTRLIVEDDGVGFDVGETIQRAIESRRLGIFGMRERAELIGGHVEIESAPGQGTAIFLRIPSERGNERV